VLDSVKLTGTIERGLFARKEATPVFAVAVTCLFCVALTLVHASHELWRDELHCWSLGRNASGLWELLTGDRRYDGHPFLWYYLLHLISRWSRSEVYLHAVTIVLATSSAYLWLRDAGLPRILRVALLGTYCIFFEYSVLSRSYALGVFLAFLFCRLYQPRGLRILRLFVVLVLLSFTSAYGAILAAALGVFLFWQSVTMLWRLGLAPRHRRTLYWQWLVGVALGGLALWVHLRTSLPPADAHFSLSPGARPALFSRHGFGMRFWAVMFPWNERNDGTWIVSGFLGEHDFWTTRHLLFLSSTLLALWLWALRKVPAAVVALLVGVVGMSLFQTYQYAGFLRHWSHFFVMLVLASWLFAKHSRGWPILLYCLATLTFAWHIATNVRAVQSESKEPFSSALDAASFLRSHHLADEPILATPDHATSPIAGYLDRKFHWVETDTESQTVVFHNRRRFFASHRELLGWAQAIVEKLGRPVLLISSSQLEEGLPTLKTELLYATKIALRADETYAIYRLSLPPQ
jgi:hypothetical protein